MEELDGGRGYAAVVKSMMGKKRYIHSCNVAKMSVTLAEIFGEDKSRAYIAGILHDIRKEIDQEQMKKEMLQSGYDIDPAELSSKSTWHGIASAYYAREILGITDEDIINAIRFHTVARPGMSKLEKIVYLADLVSEERDYEDVEKYRAWAKADLDDGMYRALKWSIAYLASKDKKIPVSTIEAFNYYMDRRIKK